MISAQDLKQFVMLSYLSDPMLEKLAPICQILRFGESEKIFSQGQDADRLFLVKAGKILLEQRITQTLTISLSAIEAGFSFGWSAMLDSGVYSTDAVCAQPSIIYSFRADLLKQAMDEDHSLGFIISQRLLYVLKKRYDARTEQFVKTIECHPEIAGLL